MNLYNPLTGETLTYPQIEALAMGAEPPLATIDYINNKGWKELIDEDQEIIREEDLDFQVGVANQDANAMPEISAPNARQYTKSDFNGEKPLLDSQDPNEREKALEYNGDQEIFDTAKKKLDEAKSAYYSQTTDSTIPVKELQNNFSNAVTEFNEAEKNLNRRKNYLTDESPNVDIPETFFGDDIGTVQKAFIAAYGATYGFDFDILPGDILEVNLGDGEKFKLPINPDGLGNKLNNLVGKNQNILFEESYKKIQDAVLAKQDLSKMVATDNIVNIGGSTALTAGLVDSLEDQEISLAATNMILSKGGLSIQPVYEINDLGETTNKVQAYSMTVDGEVVATQGPRSFYEGESTPINLKKEDVFENYITNNLSREKINAIRLGGVDVYNKYNQGMQLQKENSNKTVTTNDIKSAFVKENAMDRVTSILSNLEGFSEEEIKTIKDHFKNNLAPIRESESANNSLPPSIFLSAGNMGRSSLSENVPDKDKFNRYISLDGLDDQLKEKLQTFNIEGVTWKKLVENSLVGENGEGGIKADLQDKKFNTIHQAYMQSVDDDETKDLMKIATLYRNIDTNFFKDVALRQRDQIENAQTVLSEIPKQGIKIVEDILEPIKDKINWEIVNVENQGPYFQISTKTSLTEDEKVLFNEAQKTLLGITNTLQYLQTDYNKTVNNFVDAIAYFETAKDEEEKLNSMSDGEQLKAIMETANPSTNKNYTEIEAKKLLKKRKKIDTNIWDTVYREYGTGALMAKDFGDAAYGIALALPTIVGSDWAVSEQVRMNQAEDMYMTMGTVGDDSGNRGLFALRTLSQQFPNIILAIGTGAAGNALKGVGSLKHIITDGVVKTAVASTFGITAGADTYRNLQNQQRLAFNAKEQLTWLQKNYDQGNISALNYSSGMADAASALAYNELSTTQIIGASIATGIVEGTITRFIGSGTNTVKLLKDLKGKNTTSILNLLTKSKWKQRGLFGLEYLKRTGGELIEESAILFGTQAIAEYSILDRGFSLDQLDDTLVSTLLTAGTSNGPSVLYSAITNTTAAAKIKEQVGKEWSGVQKLLESIQNLKGESQTRAINLLTEKLKGLNGLQGEIAVDAIALGAENIQNLLQYQKIESGLLAQAGVKPNTDPKSVNRIIGQYKRRKLTSEQATMFDSELNGARSGMNEIRESVKDYDIVKNMLNAGMAENGIYNTAVKKLDKEKSKEWLKQKTPRQKLAFVIDLVNKGILEDNVREIEKKPFVQQAWLEAENKAKKAGVPLNAQSKKQWFEGAAVGWYSELSTTGLIAIDNLDKLKSVLQKGSEDFEDTQYIDANDNLEMALSDLLQTNVITEKDFLEIQQQLIEKPDVNGFAVNGRIIVNNTENIEKLKRGENLRQGLVVLHEFAHVQDDKFFGSKGTAEYAENLYKALVNSSDSRLKDINDTIERTLARIKPIEARVPFNQRSDSYKSEYAAEIQTELFGQDVFLNLEKAEDSFGTIDNIIDKVFGGSRYNINTPEKALAYVIGNNAAARLGQTSEFYKRGLEIRRKKDKAKNFIAQTYTIQLSENISIVNEINEKNKNVENYKPITENQLTTMVDKVANRTWSRFGKPIPANIREKFLGEKDDISGRKKWVNDAKQILKTIALKFDASQATFGSYMANTGMQRANAWARNEFGIPSAEQGARVNVETSKEAQSKTDDGLDLAERAAIEAKEVSQPLLNKIKSKDKVNLVSTVTQAVQKEVKARLPNVGQVSTVKTQTTLIKTLTKGFQESRIDGKPVYAKVIDDIGGRNKTINKFETFLSDNYSSLLEPGGLTTTYLSKAFPLAVEKYVNGMGWVKYNVWKGRTKGTKPGQVDFYRTNEGPYQGSTSGLQKIRRISNIKNTIPLAQFKGKYVDGINNKVKVAPTEALAKQILAEVGLDVFREEMAKENSPIKDLFKVRQDLLKTAAVVNFEAQLEKEIERPGIKFSLATLNSDKLDFWMRKRFDFYEQILKLNSNQLDKKTITRIHKEIYKNSSLSDDEHKGIAFQFGSLLTPVSKTDKAVFKSAQEFVNHLEDIAFTTDVNQSIRQFTGADKPISQMSNNYNNVVEARQFVVQKVVAALKEKYGNEKALRLLAAYAPSTFSQGQFKFGAFKLNDENEIVNHNESGNRISLFGKINEDILNNLILGKDADDNINFPNVKSIAKGKITFVDEKKEIKININTSADVQVKHLKGLTQDQIDKDKADAKLAREFTETVIEALPPKGENNNLTALILATMNASSNSALRLAAPVWGRSAVMDYELLKRPRLSTAKDVKEGKALDKDGLVIKKVGEKMYTAGKVLRTQANYRYEHAIPARVVLWYLYDSKINKNKKIDLDLLFDDYRVTIIPIEEMDNVLRDTGFSSIMLANYIPGDQTWWKRYFNRFTKGKIPYALQSYETNAETGKPDIEGKEFQDYYEQKGPVVFKPNSDQIVSQDANADIAIANATSSMKYSENVKKIRVFDFDDTLARSKSKVLYTMPDGTTGTLSATEFAKNSASLQKDGALFNFEEFNKVIEGQKGPLFDVAKKIQDVRGAEDIFVLTARPQEAAGPIKEFLESIGLNIPIKNITGLQDGTPKAKADWIINKFAEGYNDFYFTDDAIKNVKAVKDVLDVLDVKSKVQQARVKFSKNLSDEFNKIIQFNTGINAEKRYSQVVAQRLGKNKKRWNFFIPPSAEDFRGLTMYMFSGSGKRGEADMEFFNKSLVLPYTRAISAIETAKQQVSNDYRGLVRGFPKIERKLRKKLEGTEYTYDEAVRIYLWDKAGFTIPGISKRDQAMLSKMVREDPNLNAFADGVLAITKKQDYTEPSDHWSGGTILNDLNGLTQSINRKEFLKEFNENVDVIFSQENLTKIEAIYGTRVRESLENIIFRMKNGTNRTSGVNDRIINKWNNWVNNSIGAIMFFNRRSALLQLISSVNFINWSDNNPMKASMAFSNQPQFWKDVVYLFNSDKLKQRRSGLKGDVNEAEIAAAVKGAKNKTQAFISILLKYGFTFTQIADSVAISTGGATMYRNRINTYLGKGFTKAEAETKAFDDFSLISDESQQSADPMLISQQQSGVLGRFILAFQNTPMQYTRLMKKAGLDIINRRGDFKTNMSKIIYYGFIQNLIFSTLSNALFALIPGFKEDDDELTEEEQKERYDQVVSTKQVRIINGMIDTVLRGSGVAGAVISTIKNGIMRYQSEEEKGFKADHTYTIIELTNLSPPLGSKLRKIYSGIKTKKYERDVIKERGFDVTIDGKFNLSPSYQVIGDVASGVANIPLDRLVAEVNAITEALDSRNTVYQRIALAIGYRTWDVGALNEEGDKIKVIGKATRKEEGKIKARATRERKKQEKYQKYLESLPIDEYVKELERQERLEKLVEKMLN